MSPDPTTLAFFSVIDVQYEDLATGYKITVITPNPCHLWMRWTNIPPRTHLHAITKRGLLTHELPYYCFVAPTDNEQEEPGDTLIHTFLKPGWLYCETRWFSFAGTVGGVQARSTTAYFEKHSTILHSTTCINCQADSGWATRIISWAENYQTFTPPVAFQAQALTLRLGYVTLPPTVTASFHSILPSGWPNRIPYLSETKTFPGMAAWPGTSLCTFTNLPAMHDKNKKYALSCTIGDTDPQEIRWLGSVFNVCPLGNWQLYRRDQHKWYNYPNNDLWHQIQCGSKVPYP